MSRLTILALVALTISGCVGRPAPEATGAEVYLQLCSNCHGDRLQGGVLGPALGAGSNSVDQPDEFLRVTIVQGRGRMPSFDSSLSEDQVELLIGHIREVQRG
jgi:mono/diheme cytochrome c family protein